MRSDQRSRLFVGGMAVVLAVVVTEYVARHVVGEALPAITSRATTDILTSAFAYLGLSLAAAAVCKPADEPRGLRGLPRAALSWRPWLGLAAIVPTLFLFLLDRVVASYVTVPSFSLPPNPRVVGEGLVWLPPLALLAANGVVIPIAEEWLWRGIIQPRMVGALRPAAGIALTSGLFSVKHALVDASLGRLWVIAASGAVLGVVACSSSWQVSAITHIVMNSVATIGALLVMSSSTTVPLSPTLDATVPRFIAVMNDPNDADVQELFAPSFLEHFPETVAFLRKVRARTGRCTWERAIEVRDARHAKGLLVCENAQEIVEFGVEATPPYRLSFFALHPPIIPYRVTAKPSTSAEPP